MPYPSRGGWRFRNVTDGFDFTPILTSIAIEELHPDGLSTLACDIKDEPGMAFTNEDKVWVKFDGDKIWAGHVKVRTRTFIDSKYQSIKLWNLQGQDFTSKLEDSVITYRRDRPRESADARVAFILRHLNFNVTTAGVDLPAENVDRANYEGLTVREALDQVSSELLLHYYVDFGDDGGVPDLHMFRQETEAAPFSLDVDAPNYTSRFPFSEFSFDNDSQDYKNAVYVIGGSQGGIRRWVTNQAEIDVRGRQETAVIDSGLGTLEQVLAAGRRVLDQNDAPEVHGELLMHEPGIRAGMRIGVRLDAWGIDTNYFVTSVNIEAVDPEDAANEAYLFSRLTFTDKRRTGRMPGGGRRHKHPKDKGGDGRPDPGGGGPGPDVPPVPVPTPTGEFEIEDWTSTAPTGFPAEVVGQTTVSLGTSHGIFVPDGADIAGRELLLAFTTTEGTSAALVAQFALYGFTTIHAGDNGGNSQAVMAMPLTGLDGYVGVGDMLEVVTVASETIIARVAIVEGVGEWTGAGLNDSITPSVSGWTGENEILYVFGFDNADVTGGGIFPPDIIEDQTSGGAAIRIARGNVTGASNPGDWTMSGTAKYSITVAGRYADPGWGHTLRGEGVDNEAPWKGANLWMLSVPQGSATFSTTSTTGVITVGANGTEAHAALESDSEDDPSGEPWGPWADADGSMRVLWKVNRLGVVSDAFLNALDWVIEANDYLAHFRVHLGDALDPAYCDPGDVGVVILQTEAFTPSTFVDKALVAETYYQTRFDFSGDRARMKLWADGDLEPVAWDIDVAKVGDLDIGQVSRFRMVVYGGTNTSALVATYDTLWGGTGAESAPGDLVVLDLPRGDGVTTVWDIGPYAPGSPMLTVDGMATIVAETDPEAGTITFDRAPALGAWVAGTKVNP